MIQKFTFNPLGENTYLFWCNETKKAAIIDAGNYDSRENSILKEFIDKNELQITHLLGTHAHIDHIFGNWWVKQTYNVPYYLHADDVKMIERSDTMASLWNLNYTPSPAPDSFLVHGQSLLIGNLELKVRFVPGHAPGHVIFVCDQENCAVVGDTIFQGSIGRTDLPGGNHAQLLQKIREEIFTLPATMTLHCGHGESTTVEFEMQHNPFLR